MPPERPASPGRAGAARRWVARLALVVGALLAAQGLWLPVKALVAQALLERAWRQTVAAGAETDARDPGSARELAFRPWSWADTWPVARLVIASGDRGDSRSLVVLAGASGQALAFGPGLARRGARNLVIAGHRDTHFEALRHAERGDLVRLRLADETAERRYRVSEILVVDRDAGRLLAEPPAGEVLTLITCYPFDAVVPGGPLRYVVRADRVD